MLALDQAQAVEHVVTITCGLGLQPYKSQVPLHLVMSLFSIIWRAQQSALLLSNNVKIAERKSP